MVDQSVADNEIRFNVIVKALESCENIQLQLNQVEQLNSSINEAHLTNLIENSTELSSAIKNNPFNKADVKSVLSNQLNLKEVENVILLTRKLNICSYDPQRFDEAVELLQFIDILYRKYGNQIPIIESIYKQSEFQRKSLVANLCDKLENLKATTLTTNGEAKSTEATIDREAINIVNNLIRCSNFSDRELRLKYLQARDNWFNNACEEKSDFFDDVVLVYCKGLPMIFEEYKTIFNDLSSNLINLKLEETSSTKEDGAIINSWLLLKASIFIASLEVYLKQTSIESYRQTPTMMAYTMSKCFELTNWLSSIGFDFSSQLIPLFQKALLDEIKSGVERATTKFETSFITIASKSIESLLLPVDDDILRISSNVKCPDEQLPKSIEHYPIFKVYCLYLIESLRWAQATRNILSPIGLCLDTYTVLNLSLTRISKALVIILNMDNNSTHPILSKIALSFITEFLAFLSNYCEKLFPEKIILDAIGISKPEFRSLCANEPERVKNFRIDIKSIAEPLKSTMPLLLSTIET